MKAVVHLTLLRVVALAGVLAQNVVLVRYFSLAEIGSYYLLATVAYLGNAAVFVGADLNLQRLLGKHLRKTGISSAQLTRYLLLTSGGGALLVAVAAAVYFGMTGVNSLAPTLFCIGLSVSMYLSSVFRNLLQLSGKAGHAATVALCESLGKALAMALVAVIGLRHAQGAVLASAGGSLAAAALGAIFLKAMLVRTDGESYIDGIKSLMRRVAPVGGAGLLNWAQLQGYRPITTLAAGADVVGTISFLTTLGSTAANAVFTILAQVQIPRLYASDGGTAKQYLKGAVLCSATACVAVIPAGIAFLYVTGRMQLLGLAYLLVVGVLIESGNALIGVATNLSNAKGLPLWHVPIGSGLGLIVSAGLLGFGKIFPTPFENVALALVLGQFVSVIAVFLLLRRQLLNSSVKIK